MIKGQLLKVWIGLALLASVLPVRAATWPDNYGWRVETMGGTNLAVEDETTALNLFNLQNPAGLAFLPRQNRLDLGVGISEPSGRDDLLLVKLAGPQGEYRGLIYWPAETLATRIDLGADYYPNSARAPRASWISLDPELGLAGFADPEAFNLLISGGLEAAWQVLPGLSVGGRCALSEPAAGVYGPYREYQGRFWRVGIAGEVSDVLGDGTRLSLGITTGNSADEAEIGEIGSLFVTSTRWLDTWGYDGSEYYHYSSTRNTEYYAYQVQDDPRTHGMQMSVTLVPGLDLGVAGRITSRTVELREEITEVSRYDYYNWDPAYSYTETTRQTFITSEQVSERMAHPMLKAQLDLTRDLVLRAGFGFRISETHADIISPVEPSSDQTVVYDGVTISSGGVIDVPETTEATSRDIRHETLALGVGCAAFGDQLQGAVQLEKENVKAGPLSTAWVFRQGVEYRPAGNIAARVGMAWFSDAPFLNAHHATITVGAGIDLTARLSVTALVKYDYLWSLSHQLGAEACCGTRLVF